MVTSGYLVTCGVFGGEKGDLVTDG